MTRVKRGNHKLNRRKKILKRASGYYGAKGRLYKSAKEQVERSLVFAYTGRRLKKRDFRSLWITRINAACRINGTSYSRFISALKNAEIELDRKVLAHIALHDPDGFAVLVKKAAV